MSVSEEPKGADFDLLRAADMANDGPKFEGALPADFTGYVRFYEDKQGNHRFRARARNGEVVLPAESYTEAAHAREGLDTLRRVLSAPLIDEEG